MSRIHTFLTILIVSAVAYTVHLVSIAVFEPLKDNLSDTDNLATFDGIEVMTEIQEMLIIWVPVLMVVGVFCWAFLREWRRQRTTDVVLGGPR